MPWSESCRGTCGCLGIVYPNLRGSSFVVPPFGRCSFSCGQAAAGIRECSVCKSSGVQYGLGIHASLLFSIVEFLSSRSGHPWRIHMYTRVTCVHYQPQWRTDFCPGSCGFCPGLTSENATSHVSTACARKRVLGFSAPRKRCEADWSENCGMDSCKPCHTTTAAQWPGVA